MTWPPRTSHGFSQGLPQDVPGGDVAGKGGIPKAVPPSPLQRWRRPRREFTLRSHLALWRHVKNEDSYMFWKDFRLARDNREGLCWVCFWHGPQGCPQACPKGSKRHPKVSPKVPKGHPKAPKTYPKVPKIPKGVQQVRGEYLRWEGPPPAPFPERFGIQSRDLAAYNFLYEN